MADDTTSVPGSLFGNMPINQSSEQQAPRAGVTADDDTQSYVDFYARLGGGSRSGASGRGQDTSSVSRRLDESNSDDLEASLLGSGSDVANSRFDLRPPSADFFTKHRKNVKLLVAGSVILLIVIMLWWVTGGGRQIDPPAWEPPESYQVSFVMTLASGLEEPGVAMVDQKTGAMRVSYYSGMTTYIINETGSSWFIVPRIDKLTCFEEDKRIKLQHVFPDAKRFKYVRQRDLILAPRGAKALGAADSSKKKKKSAVTTCEEWVYHPPARHGEGGYIGTYTLWTTPGTNGVPVRFSFVGHNVILGSSHYDNYTIDYYNFRNLEISEGGVDPIWFKPPRGMPCINITNPGGPTLASSHMNSLQALFPENNDVRDQEYDRFHARSSQKEKSAGRNVIFQQTLRLVNAHNRDTSRTYKLGLNFMADWTFEERAQWSRAGMKRLHAEEVASLSLESPVAGPELGADHESHCSIDDLSELLEEYSNTKLPDELDYVKTGLTLPPGEQGTCGSCWAFAATGCIEGQIAKKTQKPPVGLSEQNLMDCSWSTPHGNFACNGGEDYFAYAWAIEHNQGQVATEESYPFLNQDGFCHFDLKLGLIADGAHAQKEAPHITKCVHVTDAFKNEKSTPSNDDLIKSFNLRLFSQGPLSVSIDASPHDFYFYESGVYNNPDCKSDRLSLDHAVLAVGYNLSGSEPYTIVRNNWGRIWGEKGYARISQKNNLCGVATAAMYVELEGSTAHPTHEPSSPPTTLAPTPEATNAPTLSPTATVSTTTPTLSPTRHGTAVPTQSPSHAPTRKVTTSPSRNPTRPSETDAPVTFVPSLHPTQQPKTTTAPTLSPTRQRTQSPSHAPTRKVTTSPSRNPTRPSETDAPVTSGPSMHPTLQPATTSPTNLPTRLPTTGSPTFAPSKSPTPLPPSNAPTLKPTMLPTVSPTTGPPTAIPTAQPTTPPPTNPPTPAPTTPAPTAMPTLPPTAPPTLAPSSPPTNRPTDPPTNPPTNPPTSPPTNTPTTPPTNPPSETQPPSSSSEPNNAVSWLGKILRG